MSDLYGIEVNTITSEHVLPQAGAPTLTVDRTLE